MLKSSIFQISLAMVLLMNTIVYAQSEVRKSFYTAPDGVKIYYEIVGKGDAVVLVHGFVVNGESWKKCAVYSDLIKEGYMVITMDLRGNGQSDKPHDIARYQNDMEAKDVMGIISQEKILKYSVAGYSRGAIIASRLLVLDARVTHTVMGGMGSDFTNPDWPRRIMFYEALSGKPVKELEGLMKHIRDAGLDQAALACMQGAQPSTSKDELAKVKTPVMIVCGTEDVDNGSSPDLAALIPGSVYKTVPGDHGGAVRTPEFSQCVVNFVRK